MKKILVFLSLVLVMGGFAPKLPSGPDRPKNVILLIGDGMGLSQMSAAFYYGDDKPNFTRFPVIGLITTSSCKEKITDSAAGATAFSTGSKTSNGRIAMDKDGEPLETLVETFSEEGLATGLVSTSSITHATPAAFYAHERSRNSENAIARQMAGSGVDFFAGGGTRYFEERERQQLAESGFQVYLDSLQPASGSAQRLAYLLADEGLPPIYEGRGNYLTQALQMAVDFLSDDEDGFFLMLEASQIDWGGHANNSEYLITEVVDFDKAVGAALDFAEKDGNTLVIVTADHETGGFTLAAEEKKVPFQGMQRDYNSIQPRFSTGGHSAALVPVLAYGPGAGKFSGIYPNTEVHKKIMELRH